MPVTLCEPTPAFPEAFFDLLTSEAYPHPVSKLQLIETHLSWVLLTGSHAYKLKRPVVMEFVDLSSGPARETSCREELRLNRRFSTNLYEDVVPVTRLGNRLRMGGKGEVLEHAVRMRQFSPAHGLDRLLDSAGIEVAELDAFGRSMARIQGSLPMVAPRCSWGEPQSIIDLMSRNVAELETLARRERTREPLVDLGARLAERATGATDVLARRRASGKVRECHGDLHARNVARWQGGLVAFDCLEFDPQLRWIDVADDVAFLNVDLMARDQARSGHAFLEGWLAESGDYDACRVLDLYRTHRALVRAKVCLLDPAQRPLYSNYVTAAENALTSRRVQLILLCGLAGSGKTRLATDLAPLLDATHLRSDVERKRAVGLTGSAHSDSRLGEDLYSRDRTEGVYATLLERASSVLDGGRTVLVDASFMLRRHRENFVQLAHRIDVPVALVHCTAPLDVLRDRVAQRHAAAADASEADLGVLAWQQERFETPARGEARILDVSTTEPSQRSALRIASQLGV